jgi:hypothetical protein
MVMPTEDDEQALEAGYTHLAETHADDQAERRVLRDRAARRHSDH